MNIIEWFKNLFAKLGKKDYMLNERNTSGYAEAEAAEKAQFVERLNAEVAASTKSREEILRELTDEIIVDDLSETYIYNKFSEEEIRKRYDKHNILSAKDVTAVSCLYGAIKEGNTSEPEFSSNKINTFLKDNPNNIVLLINLMIKDAQKLYEEMMSDPQFTAKPASVQALIPGSYMDVSSIIEEYQTEVEAGMSQE